MDTVFTWLSDPTHVTLLITGAIAVASFLEQMIPNQADPNSFLNKVVKVLQFFSLNWGTDKTPKA